MLRRKLALVALAGACLLLGAGAPGASADLSFCPPGTGAGHCENPEGVAADFETGRVYVADKGNDRIEIFESDGTFVSSFSVTAPVSVAVDNVAASASRHDLYVGTAGFQVRKFSPAGAPLGSPFGEEGTGACQIARPNDPLGVGPAGDVYVADHFEEGANNFVNRIVRFDSSGACLGEVELFEDDTVLRNFAVDSAGNIYVTVEGAGGVIRKYDPSGTLLYELDPGTESNGLAVDEAGNLFAQQREDEFPGNISRMITEYSPSGAHLTRFGYGAIPKDVVGLAAHHSADGEVYASVGGAVGIRYFALPPAGPVIAATPCKVKEGTLRSSRATLQAEVNPEGEASHFHFDYLTQAQFEANGETFAGALSTPETPLPEPEGPDFKVHEAAAEVQGLAPETEYRCRVVAENPGGETIGEEGTFTTEEGFKFGPIWSAEVKQTTAVLNAEGNPLGTPAKGRFEYVEDALYQKDVAESGPEHGFDHASLAPGEEIDFGSGEAFVTATTELSGLTPGTLYHYRLRVKNGTPPEGLTCPERKLLCPEHEPTFRTYETEPEEPPDDRRYELVSPGEKNSAEVAVPGAAGGLFLDNTIRVQAAAGSGEEITYTSWTSFGEAEGAPGTSQYLSRRGAGGWSTENISPFGFEADPLDPPYRGFSPDLRFGAIKHTEPSLAEECPEGFGNLYLRDDNLGSLRCLSTAAPNSVGTGFCLDYAGSSQDGTRAFFSSNNSYADAPTEAGVSLYEWSAAEGLRAMSILPGQSEPVTPAAETGFGERAGNCQTGQKTLRHVVSADGSRVFWTYVPPEPAPSMLLARVNHTETIQLDEKPGNPAASGKGVFWTASADGSVAFFTDTNRLVSGAKAEAGAPDLYRYELGKPTPLTDLTKGSVPGGVQGVVGASDDGSYLYFVATAALSGEEENSAEEKAQAGKDNLYAYHEGKAKFVAVLAPEDVERAVSDQPRTLSARVSPDGRHLAFLSVEAKKLAGYDNTIASGEHCQLGLEDLIGSPLCTQAFLYDFESGQLSCASCNPSGSRPTGPSLLPGWTNVFEGPRYLAEDGSRLLFESLDPLLPADENQERDVYEFERPGAGSCGEESPSFDSRSGGCRFLLSSGTSKDESYLLDASSDGRDAFLASRERLVGWDQNDNFDVYDLREGGGFPEPPPPPPPCEGEGCRPAPTPSPAAPATPGFSGAGNAKPTKPKPKKHHKKHHHHKKHKHHHRAGGNR